MSILGNAVPTQETPAEEGGSFLPFFGFQETSVWRPAYFSSGDTAASPRPHRQPLRAPPWPRRDPDLDFASRRKRRRLSGSRLARFRVLRAPARINYHSYKPQSCKQVVLEVGICVVVAVIEPGSSWFRDMLQRQNSNHPEALSLHESAVHPSDSGALTIRFTGIDADGQGDLSDAILCL